MKASLMLRGLVSVGLLLQVPAAGFAAQCKIQRLEAPVTMQGLHPTVTAKINGKDAVFQLNSAAWWSSITPAAAEEYQLHPNPWQTQDVIGSDGRRTMQVATIDDFAVFNTSFRKIEFLVGDNAPLSGAAGRIGLNFLSKLDVEYDLAQGSVNLLKTTDCRTASLVYWGKPGEMYSRMDIERVSADSPHTIGTAYLNGNKVRTWFDTGSTSTWVNLYAAQRAGVKPGDPGVEEVNFGTYANPAWGWIGTFSSFKIGDEEIHNARLRFRNLGQFDMVIGADFFLSHHIVVANSQSKLYFTYNGGPVFNYEKALALSKTEKAPATTPDSSGSADASALARRAAGYAARHDYEHALQDFNSACELAPNEASYFYQRGSLQLNSGHGEEGAADIETALRLNPDYVDAHFVRADIRLHNHQSAQALQDLDAVNRLAPKEAVIRLELAGRYESLKQFETAIDQLDLWIAHHPGDRDLVDAFNGRCWDRAVLNVNIDQALDDCNSALRLRQNSQRVHESRAFVYVRRKEFAKAIADCDAALKQNPRAAFALYFRGVAQVLTGKQQDGSKDISAAIAIDPAAVDYAKRSGIEAPGV